jgi:hypothetical protein
VNSNTSSPITAASHTCRGRRRRGQQRARQVASDLDGDQRQQRRHRDGQLHRDVHRADRDELPPDRSHRRRISQSKLIRSESRSPTAIARYWGTQIEKVASSGSPAVGTRFSLSCQ